MEESPTPTRKPVFPVKKGSIGKRIRTADRRRKLANAGRWILALGVLFAVLGTAFGIKAMSDAKDAHMVLAQYNDSDIWSQPVNGETLTVGEMKKKIDMEPRVIFITNYILAAIMIGLFFWCKKSPLPAATTALCVYLAVIVLNAIIDPITIIQGYLIKILFIIAMIGAIKAALADKTIRKKLEESPS